MFETPAGLAWMHTAEGDIVVDRDDPDTWPDDLRAQWLADRGSVRSEAERSRRSGLVTRAEIAALPPLEPIIDGYLYAETLARLVGEPGSYKSFLAMDWACCIVTGRQWHGRAVKQGAVVYLVGEGVRGVHSRLSAWERHYNDGNAAEVVFYPEIVNLAGVGHNEAWAEVVHEIVRLAPVLVVVDTQARYTPGAEENSARDMGLFVHQLDELQRFTDAAVLVVHHVARGSDHGRGSTAVEGAMQTELLMRKTRGTVELSTIKQKDSEGITTALAPYPVEGTDSMVLVSPDDADPFTMPTPPRVNAKSPVHERLARVLFEAFGHGKSGATKTEAKSVLQGDAEMRIVGETRTVTKRFSEAWSRLEQREALEQVDGMRRFKLTEAYAVELELTARGADDDA